MIKTICRQTTLTSMIAIRILKRAVMGLRVRKIHGRVTLVAADIRARHRVDIAATEIYAEPEERQLMYREPLIMRP